MTVLFLEKVFLKRRKNGAQLRGVEIFNLNLIREMASLGAKVTVVCEKSWASVISAEGVWDCLEIVALPHLISPAICGIAGAFAVMKRRFDFILLGNVGDTISPAISILRRSGAFGKMVLIAHRETSPAFLKAVSALPGYVISVCGQISRGFSDHGIAAECVVDYGVMNAERFFPRDSSGAKDDGIVRFCVLGALDSAWKGADTAIEAFSSLPESLRRRAELHLMAYSIPPHFPEGSGIFAYSWKSDSTIPEFLRGMDVMIVPSRDECSMRETFSQATVQGMLTGLPVLYSDLPVLKEKFDNGGGICFSTVPELASAMEKAASDPLSRREMGAKARSVALDRYVWDTARFLGRYFRN